MSVKFICDLWYCPYEDEEDFYCDCCPHWVSVDDDFFDMCYTEEKAGGRDDES